MRIAVTIAATIWILMTARDILQPVVVGLLVWLVLTASARKIAALLPARVRRGKTTVRIAGGLGILAILLGLGILVGENIAQLGANMTVYEANLDRLLAAIGALGGFAETLKVDDLLQRIDLRAMAIGLAGSTASYVAVLFAVIVYAIFIFVEAEAIDDKIAAFAGSPTRERRIRRFLEAVRGGIDDFLGVQVLIGCLQAVPTYLLLAVLGVDAALFFAFLIFLFSFIPTIGTLIGIAFPALMTLLQFGTFGPFILVTCVLGVIQIVCSNVLAPQLMSRSLNLSPLVVLFAVFAGGSLWGIVGALVAVPALTIAAIVCAERADLRPIAVALSANGTLPPSFSETDEETDPSDEAVPEGMSEPAVTTKDDRTGAGSRPAS